MKLWPFQDEVITQLEAEPAALFILDMGTGKTIIAIERDRAIRAETSFDAMTLIIASKAVHDHWEHIIREQYVAPIIFQVQKDRELFLIALKNELPGFYLLNWELLRMPTNSSRKNWAGDNLNPVLTRTKFLHVIADEVHHAKSRKTQSAKVLKKIKAPWKTGLSGTPITNTPPDLWSILNWLKPKDFSSYWRFFDRYANWVPQMVANGGARSVQYRNYLGPKNSSELRSRIEPFTVQRKKEEVLPDLPDRYYTTIRVDLAPKQRRAYDGMRRDLIAWLGAQEDTPLAATSTVAKLQRLQQFALAHADIEPSGVVLSEPSAKLDALMSLLEDNPDEQFVVFTQFRGAVTLTASRLAKSSIPHVVFTGDTQQDARRVALDRFTTGEARLFVATLGAGGEGIDGLQRGSTVVFLDRSWSPAVNDQAEARLHRAGQENAVHVIDIIARDTVDQGKNIKLNLKRDWIKQVLG